MFQTINQQRATNQVLLAVAAALLVVSVYVAFQLAQLGVPRIETQVQAPASGPAIDYDSDHIREFRAGRPF
jgi:hypothetical protein